MSRALQSALFFAVLLAPFGAFAFDAGAYNSCVQQALSLGAAEQESAIVACNSKHISYYSTPAPSDFVPEKKMEIPLSPATTQSAAAYNSCVQQAAALKTLGDAAVNACRDLYFPKTPPSTATGYGGCVLNAIVREAGQADAIAACNDKHFPLPPDVAPYANYPANDTLSQIDKLLAQIAQLQELLGELKTPALNPVTATNTAQGQACVVPAISRILSRGMDGEDVREAQRVLIALGFLDAGNDTGFFGPLTEAAVQRLQTAKNIITGMTGGDSAGAIGILTRIFLNPCR